jgi:hypothetical protein
MVGQEDHEQDHRDAEPGQGNLTKNVAVENSRHDVEA